MDEIRNHIAAFLSATQDRYPTGIPLSLIRQKPRKIYFASKAPINADERMLIVDIATKGLRLSEAQFEVCDGEAPSGESAIVFGDTGNRPHTLYAEALNVIIGNTEKKKELWSALKVFASNGYK